MNVILLLCIKLSLIHLCVSDVSDGYECKIGFPRLPEIFLIKNDSYHKTREFNELFRRECHYYYNIIIGTFEESKKHDNVIYLGAPDYYEGNPHFINFTYAGDVNVTLKTQCTKIAAGSETKYDCSKIAKLVSKSVSQVNNGDIYDYVQRMQYTEESNINTRETCSPELVKKIDLKTVVLCMDYMDKINDGLLEVHLIEPLELRISWQCSNIVYVNNLLAVLAPIKLKDMLYKNSVPMVPTVFYDTPYMYSEIKSLFPNSMNLVHWRLLKYGFLKFIQTVGWQRVAIVSDDSEYSLEFENELTTLFQKEWIVHEVIRCEDANCDMEKVKQKLLTVTPRIVIANVEMKQAQYLFSKCPRWITWIGRDLDWTSDEWALTLNSHHRVFSINLGTVPKSEDSKCKADANILTGLGNIVRAYKNIENKDNTANKRKFYRLFADTLLKVSKNKPEAIAYVKKISHQKVEDIAKMHVDEYGAKMLHHKDPFESGNKPSDAQVDCLATSYKYSKPCENIYVLLLMFVIMLFIITFLSITCYFHKTSPFHDIRYQHF